MVSQVQMLSRTFPQPEGVTLKIYTSVAPVPFQEAPWLHRAAAARTGLLKTNRHKSSHSLISALDRPCPRWLNHYAMEWCWPSLADVSDDSFVAGLLD